MVWKVAKGFRGRAGNCIKIARQQAEKALQHAYRGRKEKKRDIRSLWITRINAGSREHGVSGTVCGRVSRARVKTQHRTPVAAPFSLAETLANATQVKYSEFQAGLRQLNVQLNRKVLSDLAASEPFSFQALVDQVKFMRGVGGSSGGGSGIKA